MSGATRPEDPKRAVYAAWRGESARLVGALTRMTRDVSLAEDLAQDALVAALEQWPATGVPDNPAAWLMTTAKRRAIDHFRRSERLRRKVAELEGARGREEETMPDVESQFDYIEDDVLRLIFLSCHPTLTPESRAALTLRLVCGLTTAEIARGFLATESTMGQRISRAKRTLSDAHAEFELPDETERTQRLDDVMAVIYLIFNEGYTATAGEEWMRPELANEAIRLARMLAALAPDEPEVLGLQALLEIQGSRMPARLDEDGAPVLLEEQDRSLWDQLLIRRGIGAFKKAEQLAARGSPVGRYFLQASIAAQHALAARAEDTDWRQIAMLYDVLARAAPGPVVEVNRAVAHGRAYGAVAGLAVLEGLDAESLGDSPLVPSVRGDLLERAGLHAQAREAFTDAASRTANMGERTVLQRRANRTWSHGSDPDEPPQPATAGETQPKSAERMRDPLLGRWTPERADEEWDAWTPARVAAEIGSTEIPWCVTGGWAIELFVGAPFRPHGDIEVAIPRSRWPDFRTCLSGLEFFVAGSGELFPLEGPAFEEHHQTWGRDGLGRFRVDVFREPHDADTWICRRDSRIRRPYPDLIGHSVDGIPYMAPEVVLLFKAKHDLPKDREDLNEALARMDERSLAWLADAVAIVHPGHDWLARLPEPG